MAITQSPVLGWQNLVDHPDAVLTSPDVVAGSDIANLQDPSLGTVVDLGTGTSKSFVLGTGVARAAGAVFLRFRAGWEDIESITVWAGPNSDGSGDLVMSTSYHAQFPTEWKIGAARRPIFAAAFEEVEALYWGIIIERTAGADSLEIARPYIGPAVQLNGGDHGSAVYGTSVQVESATVEVSGDLDTDFRFARGPRRTAEVRARGIPLDSALDRWAQELLYACVNRDVLYIFNPLETDPGRIQQNTLWGLGKMTSSLTFQDEGQWEGTLSIRERL